MQSDKPFIHSLESKRFFIRAGSTDFRWGIDMLAACAVATNADAALSGSVFVFCSKSRNQLRFLFWEGNGWWLLTRKISTHRFIWVQQNDDKISREALFEQVRSLAADPGEYRTKALRACAQLS